MIHYVYKQTRDTGEYYFGIHSTDNLDDGYFGSGFKFRAKYNSDPSRFTKHIIHYADSRDLIEEFEELLVDEDMLLDSLCLNLVTGGGKGFPSAASRARMSASAKGKVISTETRAKLSLANIGKVISAETRAKISSTTIGVRIDHTLYSWVHKDGATEECTGYALRMKYDLKPSNLSRVKSGLLPSTGGWSIVNEVKL